MALRRILFVMLQIGITADLSLVPVIFLMSVQFIDPLNFRIREHKAK